MSGEYLRDQVNNHIVIEEELERCHLPYREGAGEYKIVCPFHDDDNPSLSVSEDKRVFHCFGCQVSGDLVYLFAKINKKPVQGYILEYCRKHNIKFPETLSFVTEATKQLRKKREKTCTELEIETVGLLIQAYSYFRKVEYEKMRISEVFSDAAREYYRFDALITNLEYEEEALNVRKFQEKQERMAKQRTERKI